MAIQCINRGGKLGIPILEPHTYLKLIQLYLRKNKTKLIALHFFGGTGI
jgi:hypothetical protein